MWAGVGCRGDLGVGSIAPFPGVFSLPPDVLIRLLSPVLEALNVLVNQPEPGEPVRLELAEQLIQDPELFDQTAQEFTLQFGVDRPC